MKTIRFLCLLSFCATVWYSCAEHDLQSSTGPMQLSLRWVQSYPDETPDDVVTGLAWNLSFLGATLPKGSLSTGLKWKTSSIMEVDFESLGFSDDAKLALLPLIETIKRSEEYQVTGGIDIGRFIMLTLNSSYHYYAITGAQPSLLQFKARHVFKELNGSVTNSSIAKGHREIEVAEGTSYSHIAFIAAEGNGSLEDGTFSAVEFEALDIMPNGQLRFALYAGDGKLKASASAELTDAGKPAKCLWCHEINLQSLNVMHSVPGFISYEDLKTSIERSKEVINRYRVTLNSEIDFSRTQDHTLGELLYISFMQPSAYRLSNEWSMAREEVENMTEKLPTRGHPEFPFLGELFDRNQIDKLAPFDGIKVPEDAREPSLYEPTIIFP